MNQSIIAMAGPVGSKEELVDKLKGMFSVVHYFEVPDDYGEFPDTQGYNRENWETLETEAEDGNLYGYMLKCMDAVVDYTSRFEKLADKLGMINIQNTIHWPKFGGKIFACAGFVTAVAPYGVIISGRN